jgi:hypothetical protein
MEIVTEHIKGDRKDVLKCGVIAAEVALGQELGAAVCVPIVASKAGICGLVLGLNFNNLDPETQDLAIALVVKLGLDADIAQMLRPVEKAAVEDEVSYRLVG